MQRRNSRIRSLAALGGASLLAMAALAGCSSGGTASNAEVADDCTPAHEFETVSEGTLTVATYDFLPYTQIDSATELSGIEGEILTEIAKRECLVLDIQSSGGAGSVIPSVETGRADIGAGDWYRTKDRAQVIRQSAPTVLDVSVIVSKSGITSDELDQGYQVGSVSGSLWDTNAKAWLGDNYTIYQDAESIYSDLAADRVDAVIVSAASAVDRLEGSPIEGIQMEEVTPNVNVPEFEKPGQVGFPTSLENEAFGDAVDETIQDLHDDGTIAKLLEKYGLSADAAETGEPYEL
ncbi:substrate-binding periplasmic protein [Leucobacter sp. GX24907]